MGETKQEKEYNEEKAPLLKVEKKESQAEQVKQKRDDGSEYFKLNTYERILVYAASGLWSYWLIIFGLKTLEQNKTTPILGVEKDSWGLMTDKSDIQWNSFLGNLHVLLIATFAYLLLSKLVKKVSENHQTKTMIMVFNIIFGSAMYIYMFRGGFMFWLFFSLINLAIVQLFSSFSFFPFLLWGFNLSLIFLNDKYQGFNLVSFFQTDLLQGLENTRHDQVVSWHIMYNMTILRIISFGMDKYWARKQFRSVKKDKHEGDCEQCQKKQLCLKERQEQFHAVEEYNLISFFTYLLYLPVLITGPPITFNAFYSQIKSPQKTHNLKDKINYTLRTIFVFITFEIWVHINFGFALATKDENEYIWKNMESRELFLCGFNTLMFIWMKFNCLWKYSRCWALWDDVEVPENMNRCVNNNYNFEGFWRSWHRGFNQWLIRYIYLPCGGSKTKAWNIWIVFTFVAIWHDLNLDLLFWAWGICLCLIPEIAVKQLVQKPLFYKYTRTSYWKYICGLCGGAYIIFLVFTNLIGFGTGYKTLLLFLERSFSSLQGVLEFSAGLAVTSLISIYMMELRVYEKKNF